MKNDKVRASLSFGGGVRCPDCGEILSREAFEAHMSKVHPGRDFFIEPISDSRRAFKERRFIEKKASAKARRLIKLQGKR